jgi:hypothetical protein
MGFVADESILWIGGLQIIKNGGELELSQIHIMLIQPEDPGIQAITLILNCPAEQNLAAR